MPTFQIRPYVNHDFGAVYHVCLKTGDAGQDASHLYDDPKLLGHRYVGPYVSLQPELAFILEDEQGVCGYVLGAHDTKAFYQAYLTTWLPQVTPHIPDPSGDPNLWTPTEHLQHELHHPRLEVPEALQTFPSHLHIDLLPRAQGQGNGQRMMHTLLDSLRDQNSPGVHLGVSPHNHRAQRFYQKLGFDRLTPSNQHCADTVFMGKRL